MKRDKSLKQKKYTYDDALKIAKEMYCRKSDVNLNKALALIGRIAVVILTNYFDFTDGQIAQFHVYLNDYCNDFEEGKFDVSDLGDVYDDVYKAAKKHLGE